MEAQLERQLPEAVGTPCLGISALTGAGVDRLMPTALQAYEVWAKRVPTARLNRWLLQVRSLPGSPALQAAQRRLACPAARVQRACDRFTGLTWGFGWGQLLEEYRGTAQGRQVMRIRYVTQVSVRPPTFAAFVSGTLPFSDGNTKFLVNALRKHFSFPGVPMRLLTRLRKRGARRRSVSRR